MSRFTSTAMLLSLLAFIPAAAQAQTWTAEQQEVITQLEECWDIWVEASALGRPDPWLDRCTDDFRYWGDETGVPNGPAVLRRQWREIMEADYRWVTLRPLEIRIVGDVAIVHFYGSWNAKEGDGRITEETKRTEVFRNVDGRWRLIAGHSQPSGD